jgi:hypothetical protein
VRAERMVEVPDLVTSARIIDEVGKGDEVLGFVGGTGRMSVHASDTGGNSNSSITRHRRALLKDSA